MDGGQVIWPTLITSFFVSQVLFYFVSSWFSAKISPGFNTLSPQKKIEWNSRVVSTIHSLVVGTLGLYILFFDESKAEPLWGRSLIVELNISIATGYLISDLVIMLLNWEVFGEFGYILHHVTAIYGFVLLLIFRTLEYIGNFRLLAELSSPFVNQRWFFEVLKYPKLCKINIINGILMTVVFFIVRIAAIPPLYYYAYSVYGTEPFLRLGPLNQYSWIICCLILDSMNIRWMIKISKGCIKVITISRNDDAKNRLQNGKLD